MYTFFFFINKAFLNQGLIVYTILHHKFTFTSVTIIQHKHWTIRSWSVGYSERYSEGQRQYSDSKWGIQHIFEVFPVCYFIKSEASQHSVLQPEKIFLNKRTSFPSTSIHCSSTQHIREHCWLYQAKHYWPSLSYLFALQDSGQDAASFTSLSLRQFLTEQLPHVFSFWADLYDMD